MGLSRLEDALGQRSTPLRVTRVAVPRLSPVGQLPVPRSGGEGLRMSTPARRRGAAHVYPGPAVRLWTAERPIQLQYGVEAQDGLAVLAISVGAGVLSVAGGWRGRWAVSTPTPAVPDARRGSNDNPGRTTPDAPGQRPSDNPQAPLLTDLAPRMGAETGSANSTGDQGHLLHLHRGCTVVATGDGHSEHAVRTGTHARAANRPDLQETRAACVPESGAARNNRTWVGRART